VPSSIAVRQYAGVRPPQIDTNNAYMNFYTHVSAPSGFYNYDITFYYKEAWLGTCPTEINLRPAKKDGIFPWAPYLAANGVDTSANTLFLSGLLGFSYFTGTDVNNPLPVKLTSFSANRSGTDVQLNWITSSEVNSSFFDIERSADMAGFESKGRIKAAGNSSSAQNYRLTDAGAFSGGATALYYRLKTTDRDGRSAYSQTVAVYNRNNRNMMADISPNPFKQDLSISIECVSDADMQIVLTDVSGKTLLSKMIRAYKGANRFSVDEASGLRAGVYFLSLSVNGEKQVIKVVKE
jgi:hypothetical protein